MKQAFDAGDLVMDRFRVKSVLGRGGQAIVYKVIDVQSNKTLAMKQYLNVQFMQKEDLQQIENEATMLRKINHPNVLHAYQLIKQEDQYLLIMEFIDGCSMSEFIQRQFPHLIRLEDLIDFNKLCKYLEPYKDSPDLKYQYHSIIRKMLAGQSNLLDNAGTTQFLARGFTLRGKSEELLNRAKTSSNTIQVAYSDVEPAKQKVPVKKLAHSPSVTDLDLESTAQSLEAQSYQDAIEYMFAQLLEVLVMLQDNKIMHRDLKPDNLMITKDAQLKLIDFGYVKVSDHAKTMVGTPGFLAPEMHLGTFKDRLYNNKVDIWAAGALFYQMLYGYCPFLINRYLEFDELQAKKGLYLPTDLFGTTFANSKYT